MKRARAASAPYAHPRMSIGVCLVACTWAQAAVRIAIMYNMSSHSPGTRVATEVR